MSVKVPIPAHWWEEACRYGEAVTQDYKNRFPKSAHYSIRGAESNSDLWARSKMAEFAVAKWAGLDPWVVVPIDPQNGPDNGADVRIGNLDVDVKNSGTGCLIWSWKKGLDLLLRHRFHCFIATCVAKQKRPEFCELHGWCGRIEFIGRHKKAGEGHRFDPGTLFLDWIELNPMETFPLLHGESDETDSRLRAPVA